MGVKTPPTPQMILGSIVHQAIAEKWGEKRLAKELTEKNYTSDYIRTTTAIIDKVPRYPYKEERIVVQPFPENGLKAPVLAILDGLNDVLKTIGEYKTTSSGWSQQQVDEHDQLTLYSMVCYFTYGFIPVCELHALNVKNGKIKTFISSRSQEKILALRDEINTMYLDLVERGWWERKYAKTR
jgi:hypothetical protein